MFLLVLMVVLVFLGVFFRYALGASLAWYDEFASYLLVWLTFYGAVVAIYHGRHIGFEMIVDRFGPNTKRMVEAFAELFVLGFQVVLFYYGWLLTQKMGDETAVSLVWVKMGWVYSVLPITGGAHAPDQRPAPAASYLRHWRAGKELMRRGVAHPRNNHSSDRHSCPDRIRPVDHDHHLSDLEG